jgi:hypothetical protein
MSMRIALGNENAIAGFEAAGAIGELDLKLPS